MDEEDEQRPGIHLKNVMILYANYHLWNHQIHESKEW